MKTASIGLVLLITALPSALLGQSPESRIQAARERIAEAGLAASLLDVRVAEGRAKGVSMERIAGAVERRADALVVAAGALRPISPTLPHSDVTAAADAVESGIPGTAIQEVARQARAEDRPVAISVLTYLHREASLPLDVAIRNVSAALQRGSDALRELPSRSQGSPPGFAPGSPRGGDQAPAAGSAGPGRQPGTGPPAGVPGPEDRPGRGPDRSGPPGGEPPGGGPPQQPGGVGPGGQGPPGRNGN
jgi:hypothetical protein